MGCEQKERLRGKMVKWSQRTDMETAWWMLRKGERPRPSAQRLQIIWPQDKQHLRARTSHRGRKELRL